MILQSQELLLQSIYIKSDFKLLQNNKIHIEFTVCPQ